MSLNRIYYLLSSFAILLAAFVYFSPTLVLPDFIYPVRHDSLYVIYQAQQRTGSVEAEDSLNAGWMTFNPLSAGLDYEEFSLPSFDGIHIDGWYVPSSDTEQAQTLIMLHDINQSRISLIESVRQFHDRGFNVCLYDLRAHGTSGGTEFSPGIQSVKDLSVVMGFLQSRSPGSKIAVMGSGISCIIALQSAVYDGRCSALILESPYNHLTAYLRRYARREWGIMSGIWYPIFERQLEKIIEMPLSSLDMAALAAWLKTPTLFLTATADELIFPTETFIVFDSSAASKKDLFLVKNAAHGELAALGGEAYFNKISAFINDVMPRRQKLSRRKRLALSHDHQGDHRQDPRNSPN